MTPKLLAGLTAGAALSVVVASLIFGAQEDWTSGKITGEKLLTLNSGDTRQIREIEVSQGDKSLTFELKDDQWGVKESNHYPAKSAALRTLIVQLSDAELVERKTRLPDKFHLLELEDPEKEDAKSKRLRLRDGQQKALADLVIGKQRAGAFGAAKNGTYIRRSGDNQTWLSNADLNVSLDIKDWVERKFFSMTLPEISKVTLEHPGEEKLEIGAIESRPNVFEIVNLPENTQIKSQAMIDAVPQSFVELEMEDLRKRSEAPGVEKISTATVETKEGLKIVFALKVEGVDHWLSISAEGSGKAKDKADELNKKLGKWEFKVPAWKASQIYRKRSELFKTS